MKKQKSSVGIAVPIRLAEDHLTEGDSEAKMALTSSQIPNSPSKHN